MATGLEMYRALKKATQGLRPGSTFKINIHDKLDLCQLSTSDLVSVGFDAETAKRISKDLLSESLDELGRAIDIRVVAAPHTLTLIPGEGIRRAAEALKDDPQTLEEMLQEVYEIRHGARSPK